MKKYFPIEFYPTKYQIYPTKRQAARIDDIMHSLQVFANILNYEIRKNFRFCNECEDKKNPGQTVHYPDFYLMRKKESYKQIIEMDERLKIIPISAISGQNGLITDLERAQEMTGNHPVEQWGQKFRDKKTGEMIECGPHYYNQKKMRTSFCYPTKSLHPIPEKELDENGNIVYKKNSFLLSVQKLRNGTKNDDDYVDGYVKARGIYKDLRFDSECRADFFDFMATNTKSLTVKIIKDNCGDYFAVVTLPLVYKGYEIKDKKDGFIGIDIGEKTLVTFDDGTKIDNVQSAYPEMKAIDKKLAYYNRRLSKKQGWKNQRFVDEYKKDKTLRPSKSYLSLSEKSRLLERKKVRKRVNYYDIQSAEINKKANKIGIETLKVSEMKIRKKKKRKNAEDVTNRIKQKHNKNLSDSAMSDFLARVSYKGARMGNTIIEIGKEYPSTKTCSKCGFVNKKINNTKIREWVCPECGATHDRDVNAAINIREEAQRKYKAEPKSTKKKKPRKFEKEKKGGDETCCT